MATTSNKAVTGAGWTQLYVGAGTGACGLWNFAQSPMMLHVGASDPGAGDAAQTGRGRMGAASSGNMPAIFDLTLDVGDVLWGRYTVAEMTGNVTVLG